MTWEQSYFLYLYLYHVALREVLVMLVCLYLYHYHALSREAMQHTAEPDQECWSTVLVLVLV